MSTFQQSRKEDMSEFFREPNREKLRDVLRSYDGEYDSLDFKQEWIDQAKLAKHVLAIGNSGGGLIVFGVSENDDNTLSVDGLEKIKDKSELAIDSYIPDTLQYQLEDYEYASSEWEELEGKMFQVLFIDDVPLSLPLIAQKGANGRIRQASIYIRRNTESVEADQSDIDRLVDRRVKAQLDQEAGDLQKDLSQLRTLYDADHQQRDPAAPMFTGLNRLEKRIMPGRRRDFYDFIEKKIHEKEQQIDERLGLQ